jgi:Tol biopolymer transport system component
MHDSGLMNRGRHVAGQRGRRPPTTIPEEIMAFARSGSCRLFVLAIALAVGACDSPTDPPSDDDPPAAFDFSRDLIAFESERGGITDIYLITTDGSDLINITDHSAVDGDAAWSPDGSKLAFASTRDGNTEVYVMDVDGSNVTRLTNDPAIDRFPAWSPDGSTLAFSSDRDGNLDIYLMDVDGSNVRRVTNHEASDVEPVWLPDGSKIVFCSTRSVWTGNADIWSMNPDGTGLVNLTDEPTSFDCAPGIATDPTASVVKISFVSDRADGDLSIYTMDGDGSNVWRVTTDPADEFDSSLNSDGASLVFDSNRSGSWDIYTVDVDGSNLHRLTTDETDEWNPAWRP